MIQIIRNISLLILFATLSACATKTYRQADASVDATQQAIEFHQQHIPPPVLVKKGFYVDTRAIPLKKTPTWLEQRISLQARSMPLNMLVNRMLRQTPIVVSYDTTVRSQQPVTIDYSGTIEGALDKISAQTHYHYDFDDSNLTWSAYISKTFNIAFMPGTSNYLVGQSQTSSESNGNINAAAPSNPSGFFGPTPLGSTTTAGPAGGMHDQQFSSMAGQLSVWNDLKQTLDQLKSRSGKVYVSESTASVNVRDYPENVEAMSRYIAQLNRSLSKEVSIRVQVLEIQLDKDYSSGIDWNVVAKTLGTQFRLIGGLASATIPDSANAIVGGGASSAITSFAIGKGDAQTLISVLNRQGKIRIVTQPQVVTMNNQIASIRITQDTGYIQSVSSTAFGTQDSVTSTITPGTVTDGFTLYVLPRIEADKVYMQITSTLSNLLRLVKESTGKGYQQFNSIELPTIAQKAFNQRSVVASGQTLVIAGFKRLRDQTNEADMMGIEQLGGKGSQSQNIETLMLITPVILRD
jgi:type IVB pilus formation R64 PilN family outer membrane protein